ncbi:MAG: DUF2141 domain-containing protein [Paracoccaceae bacterium]
MKLLLLAAAALMGLPSSHAFADSIRVNVSGVTGSAGQIGCGLHNSGASFPTGHGGITTVWVVPTGTSAVCLFEDVAPGTYAVAVAHDLNGNRKTDTNLLGMPTEAWGVSGNIRPRLRAPRFDEAGFRVDDAPVTVNVEVKR